MSSASGLFPVGTVAVVGVLHTIVPDHWVPRASVAVRGPKSRGWRSRMRMAECGVDTAAIVGPAMEDQEFREMYQVAPAEVAPADGHAIVVYSDRL